MANYDHYVFPVQSMKCQPELKIQEDLPWSRTVTVNHRPLLKKILEKNEKNVFMWRGRDPGDPSEAEYISSWSNYYENLKKSKNRQTQAKVV